MKTLTKNFLFVAILLIVSMFTACVKSDIQPDVQDVTMYFRIKQVDFDGTSSYSRVIAVSPTEHSSAKETGAPSPCDNYYKTVTVASNDTRLRFEYTSTGVKIFIDPTLINSTSSDIYCINNRKPAESGEDVVATDNKDGGYWFAKKAQVQNYPLISSLVTNGIRLLVSSPNLPVKFVSFTGKYVSKGNVELVLQTTQEENSSYFVVEKSLNGKDWVTTDVKFDSKNDYANLTTYTVNVKL